MASRKSHSSGDWIGLDGVIEMLRRLTADGQSGWAKQNKISVGYVNDVINGRRLPGDKITRAMGLEKAMMWRTPIK